MLNRLRQAARSLGFSSSRRKALRERVERAARVLSGREPQAIGRFQAAAPSLVETACSAEDLATMFQRTARGWNEAGETEPYWSVLTDERFRLEGFEPSKQAFYTSGVAHARLVEAYFERNGKSFGALGSVLDFGCGVGRATVAFSALLPRVYGVNISAPMLDIARAYSREMGLSNVDYFHLASIGALADMPEADLFHSVLVMQHNPPPVIAKMLESCLAKVRPGGYALFQVPTYRPDYTFKVQEYLLRKTHPLQVHVLPQGQIFSSLTGAGFAVLEVQEDGMTPGVVSQTFFAQKEK